MADTNDLINRGEAILAVSERIRQIGLDNDPHVLSIRQAIRDLPSAQRTGRWESVSTQTNNEVVYRCSACDKLLWLATEYCPHCGARMERE